MNTLIEELVKLGIEVTVKYDSEREDFYYDLNSGTKSGMYAYGFNDEEDALMITGRYGGQNDLVRSISDLASVFASRYRAKGFGCDRWLTLAVEHGALKRHVEEVVTYS